MECFWRITPHPEHCIAELTDVSQNTTPDSPTDYIYAEQPLRDGTFGGVCGHAGREFIWRITPRPEQCIAELTDVS